MKTIGLLGGMSWESTEMYYRIINEYVRTKLGGLHSAKICLYSINFQEIEKSLRLNDWKAITKNLSNVAKNIELCGADFLLICTNTMHKVASEIENNINIPVLHIVDATAEKVIKQGIDTIGLMLFIIFCVLTVLIQERVIDWFFHLPSLYSIYLRFFS